MKFDINVKTTKIGEMPKVPKWKDPMPMRIDMYAEELKIDGMRFVLDRQSEVTNGNTATFTPLQAGKKTKIIVMPTGKKREIHFTDVDDSHNEGRNIEGGEKIVTSFVFVEA